MRVKVSEKGQVTIPKNLRDELGIRFGTQMEFTSEGGRLIGIKVDLYDPVTEVTGIADAPMDADTYLGQTRGPAE